MDRTDKHLLELLRVNARESVSALAQVLEVSRATVKTRMQRLEDTGFISGYTLRLGHAQARNEITAHVMISVEPRAGDQVLAALKKLANIRSLYAVSGQYDMIAILRGDSTGDIDKDLDIIRNIRGVARTVSSIVLSTKLSK